MRGAMLHKAIRSCIWCFLWTATTGSLLVRPQTQTVLHGIRVVMKCSTNLSHGVDWHFVSVNEKEEEIYSSGVLSPIYGAEYTIEEENPEGVYNLVIESAAERHAGKYICIDDEGLGSDTASATLIISKDVLQNEAPEKTPKKNNDSKDTGTEDVGDTIALLASQSTTIGEISVTTTSPTPIIVGLIVGLTVGFAIVIIILYCCLKGRASRRGKMVNANSTQNEAFLTTGTDTDSSSMMSGWRTEKKQVAVPELVVIHQSNIRIVQAPE